MSHFWYLTHNFDGLTDIILKDKILMCQFWLNKV